MWKRILFLLICCCLFTSCWHRYTLHHKVEGYVYNAETLEPMSDVTITVGFGMRVGAAGCSIESIMSDSLGYFEIPEVKDSGFTWASIESPEMVFDLSHPIIIKKEGYLNDTIIITAGSIHTIIDNEKKNEYHYEVDTLYFRPRKIQ